MNEIELKILEVNLPVLEKKLLSLGAKLVFDGPLTWTSFDYPDRSLTKNDEMIRLRKEGRITTLTYKKLITKHQAKVSEELTVKVDNYDSTIKLFRILGLKEKPGFPLHKHRISYHLKNIHFDIDIFPGIPPLLEIEGPDIETIYKYVKALGYTPADTKPWGAREVFRHYKNKNTKLGTFNSMH